MRALVFVVFGVDKMVVEEVTEGRLGDHTDCSHVSSLGGSSGQTGPGWVTAHAGGAEQTQHRPGQPHITPLVGLIIMNKKHRVTTSSNTK